MINRWQLSYYEAININLNRPWNKYLSLLTYKVTCFQKCMGILEISNIIVECQYA